MLFRSLGQALEHLDLAGGQWARIDLTRALAGTTVSPGIFETLEVLGRDEALARIDAALRT